MRILNIVETAYRATLEEQDDPILWLTHVIRGAGADVHILLRGNAVNYALRTQGADPLCFGARRQRNGPRLAEDIASLRDKGSDVYVVAEDLQIRGLAAEALVEGLKPLPKGQLPRLLDRFDRVWHW